MALRFVLLSFSALALSIKSSGWREAPLVAAGVNPLVPFYINAKPPWPGLEFLLLLGQAKRTKLYLRVKPCSFEEECFLRIDSVKG